MGRLPPRFLLITLFLPTAIRHDHAFQRDDPALAAPAALEMGQLLADPSTYWEWLGESGCGGFHGDWYLRWADGHEAIVCKGCHEVLLYHQGQFIRCRFSKDGYARLEKIVSRPGTE